MEAPGETRAGRICQPGDMGNSEEVQNGTPWLAAERAEADVLTQASLGLEEVWLK
jgi:hypothetical protein